MDVYLRNSVINALELSDQELAVYIALRSLYVSVRDFQTVSYNMLGYELYNGKLPDKTLPVIKSSFHSLVDKGMVSIVQKYSPTEFSVDMSKLYFDDDYFTVIRLDEIHRIMNVSSRVDKFKLLRYFIICLRTINRSQGVYNDDSSAETNFCGYMSQRYLCNACGINFETNFKLAEQYNSILEDHELLYVYRHNKFQLDENGEIKSLNNHYGRWEHQKLIKRFALQYEAHIGLADKRVSSKQSNAHRRLSACYNNLMYEPEKYIERYSEELLLEIYIYISERNANIKDEMKRVDKSSSYYDKLEQRLRDESVLLELPCVKEYIEEQELF